MPLYLIRKNIRPGFLFFFLCLFSSFSADPGNLWCFPLEKSEIRTLFHDFDTRISLNSSEKEETTGGRITALLSLTPESAIFPEPKDGNLRRWGFKGTSERLFSITLMDRMCSCIFFGIFSAFSSGSLWHKGFQLNVGRYDHLIFVIFIGILWDCQDFTIEIETGYVGRFLMQTLFYRLTSKRKHLTLPKNAIKENGFIFASLTSLFFFIFLCFCHSDRFFHKQEISVATYENRR